MNIQELKTGKEYLLLHAYGQTSQKVKILSVGEKYHPRYGNYWEAKVEYTSDDCSKGLQISMNTIECERYLREI
jgi:hypothetical protein